MVEPGGGGPTGKILVVDDEVPLRMLVVATLTDSAYQMLEASDGKEGLELARRERPNLVLLDVAMPEMDGYEVCQRLKADPQTRHITVVMLTAMGQAADLQRGLEAGADAYLVKPFSPIALLNKVNEVMGGQKG